MNAVSVYTGIWNNYNYGNGSTNNFNLTLTVTKSQGALLIAFLALFVSVSMYHLWAMLCLIIHQLRSTSLPQPGLYHQQQALLSNTPTTATAAWTMIKLAWVWRTKAKGAVKYSTPLILITVLYWALLTASGLLSSRVQTTNDEVLATGERCGWVGVIFNGDDAPNSIDRECASQLWGRLLALRSLEYVRNCYTSTGTANSVMCKQYTAPNMSVISDPGIPCPFSTEICALRTAMRVDTGFIDSNKHLGINTAEKDRLRFRKVITCAPILAEEKYSSPWTSTPPPQYEERPGDTFKYYYLGRRNEQENFTIAASNYSAWISSRTYGLRSVTSFSGSPDTLTVPSYIPIEELMVPDADISVLFLFNNALYTLPVDDPWFRASGNTDRTGLGRRVVDHGFYADRTASAMACTEQYQFCNTTACSALGGILDNSTMPFRGLLLSPIQKAIFNLITEAAARVTLSTGITVLGSQLLKAHEYLWSGGGYAWSAQLPSTAWQDETLNFCNLMLAALQGLIGDFANTPQFLVPTSRGAVSSQEFAKQPGSEGESELCSKVRIRDPRYSNFNVTGLVVIIGMGLSVSLTYLFAFPGTFFLVTKKDWGKDGWETGVAGGPLVYDPAISTGGNWSQAMAGG